MNSFLHRRLHQRSLGGSSKRQSSELSLQITSMADIFTIILVFLLKSYSTSSVVVSPSSGMKLPIAQSLNAPVEALKIEISETALQVENKPILSLKSYQFDPHDLLPNSTSKTLAHALEVEKKKQELIAKANPSVKVDSKILIIADQKVPYVTLKSVLSSAAAHGFTDFKLVAIAQNQ